MQVSPVWFTTVLLAILLTAITLRLWVQAIRLWRFESREQALEQASRAADDTSSITAPLLPNQDNIPYVPERSQDSSSSGSSSSSGLTTPGPDLEANPVRNQVPASPNTHPELEPKAGPSPIVLPPQNGFPQRDDVAFDFLDIRESSKDPEGDEEEAEAGLVSFPLNGEQEKLWRGEESVARIFEKDRIQVPPLKLLLLVLMFGGMFKIPGALFIKALFEGWTVCGLSCRTARLETSQCASGLEFDKMGIYLGYPKYTTNLKFA